MHPKIAIKAEIFSTIADSVYSNTHFKIREAVSNACDNNATTFILTIDKEEKKLSLFNDGNGIPDSRFEDIVAGFGRGLYRDDQNPETFFSYFGIGLLSVFKLGEKVSIYSRTTRRNMNLFTIESKEIFSEESGKKNVSDLREYFTIVEDKSSLNKTRNDLSPLTLADASKMSTTTENHFTEIIIEGVYKEDMEAILNEHDTLCEILPLKPNKKDPELKNLNDEDRKNVLRVLSDKTFCPTIEFYYSSRKGIYNKWDKYFPQLNISKNSKVHTGKASDFIYYVISAGKNIGERHSLTLRSKNILVKTNTVLEQFGPNPILDSSIRRRVYGEVLHRNMKEFIEVTRNEFIKNDDYTDFRNAVKKRIRPINEELRSSYDTGLKILKYVYDPFVSIKEQQKEKSPLKKIEKQVEKLSGTSESQVQMEFARNLFNELRDTNLEEAPEVSEYLKKEDCIDLEGDDYILRIQKGIEEAKTEKDHKRDKTLVTVPASTFNSVEILWFGQPFTVRFVYVKDEGKPYSVDFDNRILTIDTFYHEFQNYGVNFLEVILTLDLSLKNITSEDPECGSKIIRDCLELYKDSVIKMLTAKYEFDEGRNLGKIKRSITEEFS